MLSFKKVLIGSFKDIEKWHSRFAKSVTLVAESLKATFRMKQSLDK